MGRDRHRRSSSKRRKKDAKRWSSRSEEQSYHRSRSRSRRHRRRRSLTPSRSKETDVDEPEVYFFDPPGSASVSQQSTRRLSDGDGNVAQAVRAELARRWGDISSQTGRTRGTALGDVTGRLLQRSIQSRAMGIQRKALDNLQLRRPSVSMAIAGVGQETQAGTTSHPQSLPSSYGVSSQDTLQKEESHEEVDIKTSQAPNTSDEGDQNASSFLGFHKSKSAPPLPLEESVTPLPLGLQVCAKSAPPQPPKAVGAPAIASTRITRGRLQPGVVRPIPIAAGPVNVQASGTALESWLRYRQARANWHSPGTRSFGSQSYLRFWDPNDAGQQVETPDEDALEMAGKLRRAEAVLAALPSQTLSGKQSEVCAVCHDALLVGEAVRRLPCAHMFHSSCIARWFRIRLTCPLDNLAVDELVSAAPSTATATPRMFPIDVSDSPQSPSSPLYQPSLSPSPSRPVEPAPPLPDVLEATAESLNQRMMHASEPLLLVE